MAFLAVVAFLKCFDRLSSSIRRPCKNGMTKSASPVILMAFVDLSIVAVDETRVSTASTHFFCAFIIAFPTRNAPIVLTRLKSGS